MNVGLSELFPFIAVVVFIVVLLTAGGGVRDVADETLVEGITADAADQVLFRELSEVPGLPLVRSHAGSYELAASSRPAWTIVGAVLLFPVGLLFLFVTRSYRVQISVVPHTNGCRIRVVGRAKRDQIDQVSASIGRVLPVSVITRRD